MSLVPRISLAGAREALLLLLLMAAAGYLLLRPLGPAAPVGALSYPAESAGRMVERHLEFYEGYENVGAAQRRLYRFLFGSRASVQAEAVAIYQEVLDYLQDGPGADAPWAVMNTRARLLVTLAETGRREELARRLDALDRTPEEWAIAQALAFAYGAGPVSGGIPAQVRAGASLLPLGWASERLGQAIAQRAGEAGAARRHAQRLRESGQRWRWRTLGLASVVTLVLAAGTAALVLTRRRGISPGWGPGVLDRPWALGEGLSVGVRAALLGLTISVALALLAGPYFRPGLPSLWSTLFASLPMLWLIHSRLLKPRGLGFAEAFGLRLKGIRAGHFMLVVLGLLALDWAGTLGISWAGWRLGLESHWSQGLHERMIFGPLGSTVLGAVNVVLWAPVFEEIGFRGLVYTSLRARLGAVSAALTSAALFSVLHPYSVAGMLSVFWSALVLAWAYERYRSLLPGMVVHAAGNALALSTVLMFYR